MRQCLVIVIVVGSFHCNGQASTVQYLNLLSRLEYDSAKTVASQERDDALRFEMLQLTNLLYHAGQIDKSTFRISAHTEDENITLSSIKELNDGYYNFFYDRAKGNAYRHFYEAYQHAKLSSNEALIKTCLTALLRYYNSEISQNRNYHLPYLTQLEELQSNTTDRFWVTIYKMVFYTQVFNQPEDEYFKLSTTLNELEQTLNSRSPLLAFLYYEKALQADVENKLNTAVNFYLKAIQQSVNYPFLRQIRFDGSLRMMLIETRQKKFDSAHYYLRMAGKEINKADTLRSKYGLNSYTALLMKSQQKYDSAFYFLWEATQNGLQLNMATNTLEINRLNVELETQEKETANLKLKQDRTWLTLALVGAGLLMVTGYFAYANQQSKTKIQLQQKEVRTMKLEKQLKDQEIAGIDLMIEGQEKERQRMANDLHDHLGSLLATIKLYFHNLKASQSSAIDEREQLLNKTNGLLDEAYQKVRSIAHARNAGIYAQEGLLPAVRNFASKVSIANQLTIEVEEHGLDTRLENSLEITIFRIIQELITNVIKHAAATEVFIHLTQHETDINVMVEDNGKGFDMAAIRLNNTMGIYSIQKRIENLGGSVTIDSILQKGTTVIIDVPLQN